MLEGWFDDVSGRPYLEGRLIFPRLDLRNDITFLIDTGADVSLFMPVDGLRIGINYSELTGDVETTGISGVSRNFTEQAILIFSEPARNLYVYQLQLEIAPASPDIMEIPSLLGRDILNHWQMDYNPAQNSLAFQVVSADFIIPIE